jgi:ankyrin repeat protein
MSELWTDADRLEALNHLPETLHDSYFRILRRINKSPVKTRDVVRLCLQLLAFFPQRLTIQELCQAVSTPETLGSCLGQIVDQDYIARKCSSLIRKSADGQHFEFAHFTVQEFLSNTTLASLPDFHSYRISKPDDEPALGLLCLKFIQLEDFESESFNEDQNDSLSFYTAAATRWPQLTASGLESPALLEAAKSLFRPTENEIFSRWISVFMKEISWEMSPESDGSDPDYSDLDDTEPENHGFTVPSRPFHVAAALNLPEMCAFLVQKGFNVNTPCNLGTPLELSQSSFFRWYDLKGLKSYQDRYASDCLWLERTLSSSTRRNETLHCLQSAGARIPTTTDNLFLHSMILSWKLQDFGPTIELLSGGLVPTELEIDIFQVYLDRWWSSRRCDSKLDLPLEAFNDYLLKASVLNTNLRLRLGTLIWYTAVAMGLSFTKDLTRTDSRISFSLDALKIQINFAIADDNCHSLALCLDDGRITVSEVGCWSEYPSETLLHNAIRRQAVNCASLLLDRGSDPHAMNHDGRDAVIISGCEKSGEFLDMLVQRGVSLLSVDKEGRNLWHFTATSLEETPREFQHLVFSTHFQEAQKGLSMVTQSGDTPLDTALQHARLSATSEEDTLVYLISLCNSVPGFWESQNTVFPQAFKLQSRRIIRHLLEFNLDPERSGYTSAKPLHNLATKASHDWVRFIISLLPEELQSRHMDRLPIELYIDSCVKSGVVPSRDLLSQLTFDGLFDCHDGEGRDPWYFLSCSASRIGSATVQKSWDAFQCAVSHYISEGCVKTFEEANCECGLNPFFSMLISMHENDFLPAPVMHGELLNEVITSSRHWKPQSKLVVRFLKAALEVVDVDAVRVLIRNSVPVNDRSVVKETVMEYAYLGKVAVKLCSKAEGKEILQLILDALSNESPQALLTANHKGAFLHLLSHREWKEAEAHWIVDQLTSRGLDIDGFVQINSNETKETPLAWHISQHSLVMAEVLLNMGANPNGTAYSTTTPQPIYVQSPLHECSFHGYVCFLRKMLRMSKQTGMPIFWESLCRIKLVFPQREWVEWLTGFQLVCFKSDRKCVDFFLENTSVDKQFKSLSGYTALHFAAMTGDPTIIEKLVRYGFDVMAEANDKTTPLHWAVEQGANLAARTLVGFGAVSTLDRKLQSPLNKARLNGDSEMIEILERGFKKHYVESDGHKITNRLLVQLNLAIVSGDLSSCRNLILEGCPLNVPIPRTKGASPLAWSLSKSQIEIAKRLLEQGVSVRGLCGFVPILNDALLTGAASPALNTILPTLLQQFTNQGGNWDDMLFPLIAYAAISGNRKGLETILAYLHTHSSTSASIPSALTHADHPVLGVQYLLHWSVQKDNQEILRLLLKNGAPVDTVDHVGNTPLVYATTLDSVNLLLEYGASPVDVLTRSLVANFDRWGQSSVEAFKTSIRAVQQQTELSALEWLDASIPVRGFYPRDPRAIVALSGLLQDPHGGNLELFNCLACLPFRHGLGPLVQSDVHLCNVSPFPWHLYSPEVFWRIPFLGEYYRIVCQRFGYENVKIWANLEPAEGWSPLCRAASHNCTKKMENCLSLGAEIDFEGCPLGSALMIASACGQLEAVKFLIRRGARVCYEGRVGKLSVFGVARSKVVKAWLLAGRFNDQHRIKHTAEHSPAKEIRPWSGLAQARANLLGYQLVRDDETRIDCAKRLSEYGQAMRGRVAPYIEGLVFNRHDPPIRSAFATVE